jgi:hypothetical protein
MAKTQPYKAVMNGHEPAVRQPPLNGWDMSWNPDDGRWYVSEPVNLITRATFRELRNAAQFARKHKPGNAA